MKRLFIVFFFLIFGNPSFSQSIDCSSERNNIASHYSDCNYYITNFPNHMVTPKIAHYGIWNRLECFSTVEYGGMAINYTSPLFNKNCHGSNLIKPKQTPNACSMSGSVVKPSGQIVGEKIQISGAPFELMYFSNWAVGRLEDYSLLIPLTDGFYPQQLISYDVTVKDETDSIIYSNSFTPNINLAYEYTWNGANANSVFTLGPIQQVELQISNLQSLGLIFTLSLTIQAEDCHLSLSRLRE